MWSKQIHNTISKKYCCKLIQIQWKMILSATFINQIHTQFHTDCWSWLGIKCKCKNQQIQMKNVTNTWKKLLVVPNEKTGGARQAAVASQPMHVWKFCQRKSSSLYPDFSNKSTFLWVQAILKAQEACKVKLSCFKGIVHPTHFQ